MFGVQELRLKNKGRSQKVLSGMHKDICKRNLHSVNFKKKKICLMSRVKVAPKIVTQKGELNIITVHADLILTLAAKWMQVFWRLHKVESFLSIYVLQEKRKIPRIPSEDIYCFSLSKTGPCLSLKQLVALEKDITMISLDNQHQSQKLNLGSFSHDSYKISQKICKIGVVLS